MGILVVGAQAGAPFRFEVIGHWEMIGQLVTGKSASQVDLVGLGCVSSVINPNTAPIIDQNPGILETIVTHVPGTITELAASMGGTAKNSIERLINKGTYAAMNTMATMALNYATGIPSRDIIPYLKTNAPHTTPTIQDFKLSYDPGSLEIKEWNPKVPGEDIIYHEDSKTRKMFTVQNGNVYEYDVVTRKSTQIGSDAVMTASGPDGNSTTVDYKAPGLSITTNPYTGSPVKDIGLKRTAVRTTSSPSITIKNNT